MKFLLLIVLLWIVSDDASTVLGRAIDLEDSRLNMEIRELDVSSISRGSCKSEGKEQSQYRNVALGGRATQSTVYVDSSHHLGYLAMAINAIDGNQDSHYMHGSCSHTHKQLSPWWRVDLLKSYRIGHITITNRGDCCGIRLDGAEILVGDSLTNNGNNNARCGAVGRIPDGGTQTFQCNDMVGRYVNVVLTGKDDYLQLCEVEVFGADPLYDQTCA